MAELDLDALERHHRRVVLAEIAAEACQGCLDDEAPADWPCVPARLVAEVRRLRAERDNLQECYGLAAGQANAAQATIQRLRAENAKLWAIAEAAREYRAAMRGFYPNLTGAGAREALDAAFTALEGQQDE